MTLRTCILYLSITFCVSAFCKDNQNDSLEKLTLSLQLIAKAPSCLNQEIESCFNEFEANLESKPSAEQEKMVKKLQEIFKKPIGEGEEKIDFEDVD